MQKNKNKKRVRLMLILFLCIGTIYLQRGEIYRLMAMYEPINQREAIIISNSELKSELSTIHSNKLSFEQLIETALSITNERLSFNSKSGSNNPNIVYNTQEANCVGYSALYNSVIKQLIVMQGHSSKYEAKHLVAKIHFFGYDIHKLIDRPFFKDHDYNLIIEKETGKRVYVDPSLNDYFGIKRVNSN